ncbi:MAG TPA: hypothetical protein VGV38_23805 [Pyrinomonadaceae bacterium]|nr:hypothetical protein [Pyrinomonadaceae bacterium]
MDTIDKRLREYIAEEVAELLPRVVSEQVKDAKPLPEWMSESELAEYWRLYNARGELTTAGIRSWGDRPEDEHPLPYANMGRSGATTARRPTGGRARRWRGRERASRAGR